MTQPFRNQDLLGTKKLQMHYVLSTQAVVALRDLLTRLSVWVPDPDDCGNIGFTHKDDLAEVAWAFESVLETLCAIEDARWDEQDAARVPAEVLNHVQQVSVSTSDWLDTATLRAVCRIHHRVLEVASEPSKSSSCNAVNERLMYVLCSEALLGIYTHMEDSTSWDGGLHHYELLDVLNCFDALEKLMRLLYEKTCGESATAASGLLRDLAEPITDQALEHCSQDAVSVIRGPFHAVAEFVARQNCAAH